MTLLLDTHAVIWSLVDDARLGTSARRRIAAADRRDLTMADISLLEIAILLDRKRLEVTLSPGEFLKRIEAAFRVLPLTAAIAAEAVALDLPHGDPFDRVIAATARCDGCLLLTRDRQLAAHPEIETDW
ncbi:MAG: type II toxin-antitoxin system VapC family toxin [Verrucomicrobia bacterium]|nr:type II toxin-antitoxin system VapC family toxin [Verrucomicrobiota bacterium]